MAADKCPFGAECPGVGSAIAPATGKTLAASAPLIYGFNWLTQAEKDKIMFGNAMKLFKLDPPKQ